MAVRDALMGLSERQRRVVVLRYYLDLSAEEAGEVLGIRAGAVRMLSHRALIHMRAQLADMESLEVGDG